MFIPIPPRSAASEGTAKLSDLPPGAWGIVRRVEGADALRRRLLDMGLTPGVRVLLRKAAPLGDPLELFLRGYTLTLRRADAGRVWVEPASGPPPTAPGTRP